MRHFVTLCFALFLLPKLCGAQSPDHFQIFGGYSHINKDFSLTSPYGLTGWNASATRNFSRHLSVVADFAGYYPGYNYGCTGCGASAKIHTFLFGPQGSFTVWRLTPFVRFLVGDTYLRTASDGSSNSEIFTSGNSLTYGAGGGIDVRITRRIALRGQGDWLRTRFQTMDDERAQFLIPNVARVSTGVVFRF